MDHIFPHIIRQVEDIVNTIKPNEAVYLVIDGHCPMAKMHQQRKRRYLSQNMNSLHVTPGTRFMDDLNLRLTNYINSKNANNASGANKQRLCWVLSGSNEEGEGEHKIFEFIREHNTTNNVVYGLDADLIMLSIIATSSSNTSQRVSLLRDNVWIDIQLLIDAIKKEYNNISIDDYIVICMLFGNDFVPPLSYLKVNVEDFDIVLKRFITLYSSANHIQNQPILFDKTTFKMSFENMYQLLTSIASTEDKRMVEIIETIPIESNLFYKGGQCRVKEWRQSYYQQLFCNVQSTNIVNICDNYLEGIQWNILYYYDYKQASWSWYYRFEYSPTMLDLENRLSFFVHNDKKKTENILNYYPSPLTKELLQETTDLHLLLVLPQSAHELLKSDTARKIMLDLDTLCTHFYPIGFEKLRFLKHAEWEHIPILPPLGVTRLLRILAPP